MPSRRTATAGFTLIELMVTIALMFSALLMAIPSFATMRQRATLRGAGDEVLAFWNEARFEAVKRNQLVKVGVMRVGTDGFCLGAATTSNEADTLPCDCSAAAPASNVCDVARYPANQSEWNQVTLAGASLGGSTSLSDLKPVVIEPKRTTLTESADKGTLQLAGPPGQLHYKLNLNIDRLGRGLLCESTNATARLPDYDKRRCAD
jgi:prepilin-type N-terminal cleavage/methylation domain-containing protein